MLMDSLLQMELDLLVLTNKYRVYCNNIDWDFSGKTSTSLTFYYYNEHKK